MIGNTEDRPVCCDDDPRTADSNKGGGGVVDPCWRCVRVTSESDTPPGCTLEVPMHIHSMDIQDVPPLDIQTIQGLITRAHARQLNLEVSSLLSISINNCENGLLPNFYNVIRNQGEGQGTHGEEHGGVEEQQGPPKATWRPNTI